MTKQDKIVALECASRVVAGYVGCNQNLARIGNVVVSEGVPTVKTVGEVWVLELAKVYEQWLKGKLK